MSNIKLLGISALIILVLAGVPHLLKSKTIVTSEGEANESVNHEYDATIDVEKSTQDAVPQQLRQHVLKGQWKVNWKGEGAAIYKLSYEDESLVGYSIKLMDVKGQSVPDDTKVFVLKSFEDNKGEGMYTMTYEEETYEVPCKLKLKDNKLYVSYDYYGYRDTEVWERQ